MSLLPLNNKVPVVGSDGKAVLGYGQALLNESSNSELSQHIDYKLDSALICVTLLFWSLFLCVFARIESTQQEVAVPT